MAQSWRSGRGERKPPPPLDAQGLERLALRYVERFATTRAKLRDYLNRKLRERGCREGTAPDVAALAERFAELGYIDDAGYASAKAAGLARRGYGPRRVDQSLRAAGITDDDAEAAKETARDASWDAAIAFARRKKIGPFAATAADRPGQQKAIAAMVRAGHDFNRARRIVSAPPGVIPDRDED